MTRRSVSIRGEVYEALRERANVEDRAISAIVEQLIIGGLSKPPLERPNATPAPTAPAIADGHDDPERSRPPRTRVPPATARRAGEPYTF